MTGKGTFGSGTPYRLYQRIAMASLGPSERVPRISAKSFEGQAGGYL